MKREIAFLTAMALTGTLLAGCGWLPDGRTPAAPETPPSTATAAPENPASPTGAPDSTPEPASTPDPDVLDYDEIRNVSVYGTTPSTQLEGYFTVSKDGKWGLIRADGTELLACRADTPVELCTPEGHWIWSVSGMSWEEQDALSAQLAAEGENGICPGHGGGALYFFYDLDAPGRDMTAFDTGALRAYVSSDGPGDIAEITDEMWNKYGGLLPVYDAHEEGGDGDPVYPSDPVPGMRGDGRQVVHYYASREGWALLTPDVQVAGFFFDEPLAPVQLTGGKWAYLGRDSQEPVTEGIYDPTCDTVRDSTTGLSGTEPLYAAHLQNGYAAVRQGSAWGLLGPDGTEVIPCEKAGVAWEGTTLWVKEADGWHQGQLPDAG